MACFGNKKWLFSLLLLITGVNMTRASNRFANEGEVLHISCPYNTVISWQSGAKDVLVLCEGGKSMINMKLNISNRLNISRDCTILTITNFTKKDAGTYVCFVTQEVLEKTVYLQHKIHVTLRIKPTVSITVLSNSNVAKIEKNVIVRQGQHMELKCIEKYKASGDVLTLSWLFNWIYLKNNTNTIVLNNIKPEKSGEYICRAFNRAGIHYDSVNITVADIPEMPQNFRVVALKHEIIVKWLAGNSGGLLQTFLIEYRKRLEPEWSMITTEDESSELIDGLQMDRVYFLRMFSRNILGESNTTDEIIIKTGIHNFVIKSCSWEIGVLSSAAAVVFFLCLCGIKATQKRFCLQVVQNRSNISHSNATTPETNDAQYDEIESVYHNVPNVNGSHELTVNNTPIEELLSPINSKNIDNIATDNVGTGNINHDSRIQSDTSTNNLTADNVSATSSSHDSYLVPSRNYINLEIGFTNTHSHQVTESEFGADGSSASNSESSETFIKSENQYETLSPTNIVEHSYDSTMETY